MPNGNQLPFTWEDYKAYLKDVVALINYPGFRDAPEREEDLERRISEAEAMLGANPEAAFTAANLSRLLQLPYFAHAFEQTTGTSLSSWYTTYTKALPEEEELPWEEQLERQRELLELEWGVEARVTPQELWEREQEKREFGWQRERAMLPYEQMTVAEQAQLGLQRQQWQAGLMARPSDWIERWYAMNMPSPEPREERRGVVPWVDWPESQRQQFLETGRTPRTGYQVRPEQEWLMQAPQAGWQVTTDPETLGAGFIDPAEYQRAQAEAAAITAPTEVKITPTGEVSIKTPMAGKGAYETAPPKVTGPQMPMAGRAAYQAVTGPYAQAPKKRGARRKPQPPTPPPPPPTPPWLTKFAPWLTPGQPITRGRVATPSGQMWAGVTPSERAGLGGYLEWAGGRPLEDIEAHMAMMRPETPRGIAGRQWRPVRQWT